MSRVAVIGAGYWGKNLVRVFSELKALAAICDSNETALRHFTPHHPDCRMSLSPTEFLRDTSIDAVAIATPAETHGDLVRDALLAGKDVFVEKPLCLTVEVGQELVKLAADTGRVLMVGHVLWYHPAIIALKQLIDQGELGRIQYIYSNRLNLGRIRREENILWSFAPHDVSVILGLLNEMPEEVQARGGNYLHPRIADITVSLLAFPSGVKAHVFVSWLHPYKEQKLIIVGSRKMAVFDDMEPAHKLALYPHSIEWKEHLPVPTKMEAEIVHLDPGEPLRAECAHFLDCIQTRRKPQTDGCEGVRVVQVLQLCQKSLEEGGHVQRPSNKTPVRPLYTAHESAFIDEGVEIGAGTQIWHVSHVLRGSKIGSNCRIGQNVVIGPNTTIGDGVKIQNNVSVYEGVTLEDAVFCGPSVVFTNVVNPRSEVPRMSELRPTLVRQGASLGANCTIVCGVTIGRYAFVGAGAVVTSPVEAHALVVGNPARRTGWMCQCGTRLTAAKRQLKCEVCSRCYRRGADGLVERR
jgi:UDP-2-acetamido-3-amino-2,3-dideoxy-glucuronate N-acetyltransferase